MLNFFYKKPVSLSIPSKSNPVFRFSLALTLGLLCLSSFTQAQTSPFAGMEPMFVMPKSYVTRFTTQAPVIDGDINDAVWQKADWTDYFADIQGTQMPTPRFQTRMKMLWDDTYLYLAVELKDPNVWAYLSHRDDVVFHDNDFEFFVDPRNIGVEYYEIEVNPINTIFDLYLPKAYRNGGSPLVSWDSPGMKSAEKIQGTLNDPKDVDQGWTVEFAVPLTALTNPRHARIPKEGDFWRINFSRVEWQTEVKDGKYVKLKGANGKDLPEDNWVWSPQGLINMHFPERWGYLFFSRKTEGPLPTYTIPVSEKQKQYLWLVYYHQKEFFNKNGKYATDFAQLGVSPDVSIDGKTAKMKMEATTLQFTATYTEDDKDLFRINDDGFVQVVRPGHM